MKSLSTRLENFKTYWDSSRAESKKAGTSRLASLLDMLRMRKEYGFSALDYQVFGFAHSKDPKVRLKYFGALDWANANYFLNLPKNVAFNFHNKIDIYRKFGQYYRREMFLLDQQDDQELSAFLDRHPVFFAKQADNYGGFGVEKLRSENFSTAAHLRNYCQERKIELLEELIRQHEDVNRLYPYSVNSLRITTILSEEGEVHFLPSILRMGGNNMEIDNVSSGGVYVRVDHSGKIVTHGFKEDGKFNLDGGHIVEAHPTTGTVFMNYQLPHTDEAMALVEKMAKEVPEYRYIGWDIALTEEGVDMIELNTYAAYDMIQCYYQDPHMGSYEEMVRLIGVDFRSLPDRKSKVRTQK